MYMVITIALPLYRAEILLIPTMIRMMILMMILTMILMMIPTMSLRMILMMVGAGTCILSSIKAQGSSTLSGHE